MSSEWDAAFQINKPADTELLRIVKTIDGFDIKIPPSVVPTHAASVFIEIIKELLQKESAWISSSQILPTESGPFLLWVKRPSYCGEFAIGKFDPVRSMEFDVSNVTHWMSFPEPPKDT